MRGLLSTVTLLLAVSVALGQRYQTEDGNYIGGEVYDYEEQPAARPTPRSYSPAVAAAQRAGPPAPKPTPVAILKQINRHNEDGSYTYGFEGADGSFKIETKAPNGEVKGKYGFVDDSGKVRVVEYGADQYGFQPSGEGITVAPPTLVDETTSKESQALDAAKYQDFQQDYHQQPVVRPAPIQHRTQAARQQAAYPYQQPYQSAQHTQAIYAQQARPAPRPTPGAVFTPEQQPQPQQPRLSALQSQLVQQPVYEDQQNYAKTGPVQFGPSSAYEQPRPQPQTRSGAGSGGLLDQLARDYALPANSAAPLHDISFGYY